MALVFRTHHGTMLTSDKPSGEVVAGPRDHDDPRAWQKHELIRHDDGTVSIQTSFGTLWSAWGGGGQGMACRTPDDEAWTRLGYWIRPDGRVAFQAPNGKWLRAGSEVEGYPLTFTADAPEDDAAGAYEIFSVEEVAGEQRGPGPGPGIVPLHVQDDRRWFNVDLRGITAFGLAGAVRTRGWEIGRAFIDMCQAERFNVLHVITTLNGDYWSPCEIGPQAGGSWEAMDRVIDYAASKGIYTQWILYGGLTCFGAEWDSARRDDTYHSPFRERALDWSFQVVRRYHGRHEAQYNQGNEPDQTGFKHSFGKLVEDGSRLKAESSPSQLWTFGSPSSGDIGTLLTPRADFHSTHLERRAFDGEQISWVTIKRSGDDPSIDQEVQPYWHDEDWNRGEGPQYYGRGHRNDFDESPASAFCAGAHARARQHLASFHWDGGLFADQPGPKTLECMRAWHRGLDAFPRLVGDKWRGHHAQSFIDAPYAPDDDPRVVKQHINAGNLWRVVGSHGHAVSIAEHRDFDMRRFGAGTVVDRVVHGSYASGVYVR